MKLIFKALAVVGILILFAPCAKAQDVSQESELPDTSYVIRVTGDTLYCRIKFTFFGGKGEYRTDDMKDWKVIKSDDIKECGMRRRGKWSYVRPVYNPDQKRGMFLDIVEKGKINVYQQIVVIKSGFGYGTNTIINWFIAKGTDTLKELKTTSLFFFKSRKNRKDEFGEMLMDNKDVYGVYMEEKKFSFKKLRQYVRLYNTGVWEDGLKEED